MKGHQKNTNHIFDKDLGSGIYKKPLQLTNKTTNAKVFLQIKYTVATKNVKRSLVIGAMQSKAIMRHHCILTRMAIIIIIIIMF
jgi:hypothetical protein